MGLRSTRPGKPGNTTRPWQVLTAATLLTLIAGMTAACGSDEGKKVTANQAAEAAKARLAATPALAELVAAAKKEGALNLNWAFDAGDTGKALVDAFRQAYGLNIKITMTPNQDQPANAAKLVQEVKANKPASSDAYLGNPESLLLIGPKGDDVLEKVDWTAIAPWTKGLATTDGAGLSIMDQFAGFTYNTTQISENEVPKTAQDVLKLKKPIASTPYAALFNVLATKEAMGLAPLRAHVKAFRPAGFIGCGELNRVASGEFAALWVSCGKNIGDVFASQGAPLKTVVPKDAAVAHVRYVALAKNAQHPNAAKLWLTWLVTPEAQKIMFKHEFADNRLVPGSQTAKQFADYEAQGVKFVRLDYESAATHREIFNRNFKVDLIKLLTVK